MRRILLLSSLLIFFSYGVCLAQEIQSPEDFLGYQVGADFKLARWETIVEYFNLVSEGSDRVIVEEVGRSTENNPYIMATISSPETIRNIDHYKSLQRKLSHPNEIDENEKDNVLKEAKSVILVACALHSTEIGSSQMSMELLYQLATENDERTREILENDIILLVPSANPDGINKVIDWYEKSLGKPWEGMGMPWLYQKYTGHDDNRDWYMITQKETQILTRVLYDEWYPSILYDIHQMDSGGCRFFVPPFYDPVNPNVDPLIHESLKLIGGHMSTELAENGKEGVITNAIYDNWWHGGNRTTPYRHNIVGLLSEAASPRIASPIFQRKSQLRGHRRGLKKYAPQVNFTDPWDGGWWRLRDVVEYEEIACYALFTVAARYRDSFNQNYLTMGERAIRLGKEEPPYAFIFPLDQRDVPTAVRLLQILNMGGIDVSMAEEPFTADGVQYDEGTYVIFASQPYRNHLRDLLEPQDYPDRRVYPGGPAEPPYDVAGWTLSYQMGVDAVPVQRPFNANTKHLETIEFSEGEIDGSGSVYASRNRTTNDFILLNRSFREGIPVSVSIKPIVSRGDNYTTGCLLFSPDNSSQQRTLTGWIEELGLEVNRIPSIPKDSAKELIQPQVGLYQPWAPSMDEGWTRFVLEQFEFDYDTLHNADVRAGNLNRRHDVIILPDIGTGTLLHGMSESRTAPKYVGGIGQMGVAHLQEFVKSGGTLLCLDTSSMFAINYFNLPVKNGLSGLNRSEFFCPGSILRVNLDKRSPLAWGMDDTASAYFARSYAYEFTDASKKEINIGPDIGNPIAVASYDDTITLLSGWIMGEKHLTNKAALVSVSYGNGQVVLYGFRVQHRAQPHGTFRLLFNGIVMGNMKG